MPRKDQNLWFSLQLRNGIYYGLTYMAYPENVKGELKNKLHLWKFQVKSFHLNPHDNSFRQNSIQVGHLTLFYQVTILHALFRCLRVPDWVGTFFGKNAGRVKTFFWPFLTSDL